jgi:hypothetical protein
MESDLAPLLPAYVRADDDSYGDDYYGGGYGDSYGKGYGDDCE